MYGYADSGGKGVPGICLGRRPVVSVSKQRTRTQYLGIWISFSRTGMMTMTTKWDMDSNATFDDQIKKVSIFFGAEAGIVVEPV